MQLLTENCSRRVFLKKGTAGVIATTGLLNFGVNSMLSSTSSLLNDRNSKVLTKQGGFTSGIEGPATDSEGNLYAVNYQQQHTIGKITPEGQSEIFVTLPLSLIHI